MHHEILDKNIIAAVEMKVGREGAWVVVAVCSAGIGSSNMGLASIQGLLPALMIGNLGLGTRARSHILV